jgi:arylsulfatase A-like enzyme
MFTIMISASTTAWCEEENKPNIILILADDMGYGDLAIQNPESKIPTPKLDQLAKDGMRFTDAHSPSAVCTPTRYSILTGRYSWRGRLKKSVLWPWDKPLIEEGRLTISQLLKNAGYETALIGKWHLGWNWPTRNKLPLNNSDTGETVDFTKPIGGGPITVGFDYYFGDDVPNFPPYVFIENDRVTEQPVALKPDSMVGINGVMADGWDLNSVMPALKKKAIDYIGSRRSQSIKKPFFLFVSLTAPHIPIAPAKEYVGKSEAGAYGDFVYQVDKTVGDILQALEDTGQSEDTLVIFTSDNGSPGRDGENMSGTLGSVLSYGHNPSRPWRGIKGDVWEGGHRVPFIARWPAMISEGSLNHDPIILTDIMATIADILNIDLPENAGEDSLSLLPALSGTPHGNKSREAIILHSYEGLFAIRKGKWKLIQGYGGGGITGEKEEPWFWEPMWQLYDLATDPHEDDNVYSDHPDVVKVLSELLESYKKSGRSVH